MPIYYYLVIFLAAATPGGATQGRGNVVQTILFSTQQACETARGQLVQIDTGLRAVCVAYGPV